MKIIIKSKASVRAKGGVGSLTITVEKRYYKINAVVFSREQANVLKNAADKACKKTDNRPI